MNKTFIAFLLHNVIRKGSEDLENVTAVKGLIVCPVAEARGFFLITSLFS